MFSLFAQNVSEPLWRPWARAPSDIAVHRDIALGVEDGEIHGASVQIDAAGDILGLEFMNTFLAMDARLWVDLIIPSTRLA